MTPITSPRIESTGHEPGAVRAFLAYARGTAWVTLAAGLLIVLGWQMEAPDLAALFIGTRPIRIDTAVGFIIGATALLAVLNEAPLSRRLRLPLALAALVLGALSLIERLGVIDLRPGRWILAGNDGWGMGAMPIAVGVFFVALGLHAAIHCCCRDSRAAEILALVMLGTSMITLAALGVSTATGVDSVLSPATPGAAMLLLANALAWIAARPFSPLCAVAVAQGQGGYIARRLLLPAMLLPLVFSWLIQWARTGLGMDDALLTALSAFVTGGCISVLVWWVAYISNHAHFQHSRAATLDNLAHTDALTGLANRRAFDALLSERLHGLRTQDRNFCLLILDADHFKAYNDEFGHPAGDAALRLMGLLLRHSLRPGDHAARIGGEEFVALLEGADPDSARQVAERVRAAFAAHAWPERTITVSVGVAQAQAADTAATLLARADGALYEAKNAGRDRVIVADDPRSEQDTGEDPRELVARHKLHA